ncbi:MAG TPA: DeoR family transcriptional regulator [Bacillota bacterium]|nr:DeoR family transcriptional regulator [Bacillota bacterium]
MQKRASTKEKLLNILKKDHESTIKDIMVYFSISEIAVRRHLNELESQDFVQRKKIKQDIGRPYYVYCLTEKGHQTFPNQFEQLPLEILQDLEDSQGKQVVNDVLNQRMSREIESFNKKLKDKTFDEKVAALATIQDNKGYMIEYEKNKAGDYEIKNYNCPIINIASQYRQLCTNEKKTFSKVFPGSEVISKTCITRGDHYCQWVITKPKQQQ